MLLSITTCYNHIFLSASPVTDIANSIAFNLLKLTRQSSFLKTLMQTGQREHLVFVKGPAYQRPQYLNQLYFLYP